jgi:hypothetical protein
MGVLLRSFVGITDDESGTVFFPDNEAISIFYPDGFFYDLFFDFIALVPDPGADDEGILLSGEVLQILSGEQSGIGNDDRFRQAVLFLYPLKNGKESMALERVSLKDVVPDGIPLFSHQKAEHDLGLLELPVLGKTDLPQVIFVFRFEVQSGHVVEDDGDVLERFLCVGVGDAFGRFLVPYDKSVQKLVQGVFRYSGSLIAVQVVHRLELADGMRESGDNKMTKHLLRDGIEADPVEQGSEDELGTDRSDVGIVQFLQKRFDQKSVLVLAGKKCPLFWVGARHHAPGLHHQLRDHFRIGRGADRFHDSVFPG